MDIHQVGERVVAFIEEVFVKVGARDDFAAVQREVFENGIFTRGKCDGLWSRTTERARVSTRCRPIRCLIAPGRPTGE